MLRNIFLSNHDFDVVLDNFYKFPAPDVNAVKKRDKQIKQIIEDMGHKYRLSRSMPKVKA